MSKRSITAELPEFLYKRIERLAASRETHNGDLNATLVDSIEAGLLILEKQAGMRFGALAQALPTTEAALEFVSASRVSDSTQIAALARLDGDSVRLSVLLPETIMEGIDEHIKVLQLDPVWKQLYGTIDRPTTLRHLLSEALHYQFPLDDEEPPIGAGRVRTLYLPQRLIQALQNRLAEFVDPGCSRANAGLGTIIRRILAISVN